MFKKLKDAFVKYQTYRATYYSLSVMSDNQLKDIGISRSEIKYIAKKYS